IANVIFPLVVCLLNCVQISKRVGYSFNIGVLFARPFIASFIMGIFTFISYHLIYRLTGLIIIATAISVIVSIVCYFILVLKLKCLTKEELCQLPFGRKIASKLL
ncbi:MAG: polysaccharide biosynthesis C-terminal domain-containing protein, partial [Lachnospiraceae bacterium]|nr:polysaccharide biosynthesis C-terminal domain-containing protein [Lachnospiraceae bacterium]